MNHDDFPFTWEVVASQPANKLIFNPKSNFMTICMTLANL
jgi:hypothetical protein